MKLKGRSILVICLLIFGGYAVYDYLKEKKSDQRKESEAKLLTINFDQVESIEIQKGADNILLKRTVDGWNLEKPLKDLADDAAAEDLIKLVAADKIIDVAKEGSDVDWKVYGLDQPAGVITFTNSAGQKNTFAISAKTNFENNLFARRDSESRVIVIKPAWEDRIKKTANDFRDRRFLRHRMAAIEDFKLKNSKGLLEIALKDGRWVAVNAKDITLDQQKVRELLKGVADAKAANYVEGKMPTLKNLFVLDLKLGDKAWKAEVGQAADKKIYAKVSEPQFQMLMEAGALDKLIDLKIEDLKEVAAPKDDKKNPLEDKDKQAQIADKKDK